ncbi:MAG: response regulator [Ignavibacteria bacterium]|nr:response regulator [Ignavibacteria bacterium]MBI3765099.1 response regulator [Ignavibacteriales bacterium]
MSTIRILVADDDPELGKIIRDELLACGYDVHIVENGEDAISQLERREFDIAIIDIRMPKVDGFGVLKFIKREKPAMKTIMLTAYADLKHLVMSQEGGADEFLTKPYDFEMLRLAIETLVPK